MATCATCRYWIESDTQHPLRGFGACGRMRVGMYDPDAEIVDELAVVIEGTNQFSALKCKADFGCALHELPLPEAD
jgi:hypothetical protein